MANRIWLTLCTLVLAGFAFFMPATRADESVVALQLRRIVSGVIEYSQWPQLDGPVQVCVAGHELLEKTLQNPPLRSRHGELKVRSLEPDASDAADCNLVYAGNLSDTHADQLLQPLVGKPVVTIRQDPPHCGGNAFFCVYLQQTPIAFEVNLDLVARSGVRLNPWVLTLANPEPVNPESLKPAREQPKANTP